MSTKLPNIAEKESKPQQPIFDLIDDVQDQPQSKIGNSNNQKKQDSNQEEYQQNFEEASSLQNNSFEIKENQQKNTHQPQNIVSLKENRELLSDLKKEKENITSIQTLKKQYSEKQLLVSQFKQSISKQKNQIKQIGDKVDKDFQKSIMKITKPSHTSNIHDIFSQDNTINPKAKQMKEQISKIRSNIKKVKNQINKLQGKFTDPINLLNQQRCQAFSIKLKEYDSEIKVIQHQKNMLEEQVGRANKQIDYQEEKLKSQEIQGMKKMLNNVSNELKQQRATLYKIEKQDIFFMEKTKFFQNKEISSFRKKNILTQQDKMKIAKEIQDIINFINETIEERNRTEAQRKNVMKSLKVEAASIQTKNWEIFNKLRDIDSYILQFYEKKTKKKESAKVYAKPIQKSSKTSLKDKSFEETHIIEKSPKKNNDKNVSTDVILIEKKKIYDFSMIEKPSPSQLQSFVSISDEMLGLKNKIKSIVITAGEDTIYSIQAKYIDSNHNIFQGMKIGSKHLPSDAKVVEFELQPDQVINLLHVGYQKSACFIGFLHFVTSEGRQLKWGTQEGMVKLEQKSVRKYQFAVLKGKVSFKQKQKSNLIYGLTGLSLSTIFLGAK